MRTGEYKFGYISIGVKEAYCVYLMYQLASNNRNNVFYFQNFTHFPKRTEANIRPVVNDTKKAGGQKMNGPRSEATTCFCQS